MHTLAKTLGLPTSFVEIRHAATHEALPTLPLLRTATTRALDWLWENYWCSLSDSDSDPEPAEEGGIKARALLKSFRTLRRAEPTRALRSGDGREETKLTMGLIKECICIAGDDLVQALLEEKALIPAGKHKSSSMKGAILLWTPLLDALDAAVLGFGNSLLLAMLESLKRVAAGGQQCEFAEAVMAWLVHLTTSNAKAKSGFGRNPDAPVDLDGLAKQCVLYPSKWTMRLLRHLLKEHAALRGKYAGLVEMAGAQVLLSRDLAVEIEEGMKKRASKAYGEEENTQFTGKKRSIHDVEMEVEMFEARYEAMKKMRLSGNSEGAITASIPEGDGPTGRGEGEVVIGRWKKWSGKWVPRPIGVV
ncbi:Las1-like-domain-containing protein [Tuber indicum]|nr:Las1-like-domain-containing protein [Tuber indicum]